MIHLKALSNQLREAVSLFHFNFLTFCLGVRLPIPMIHTSGYIHLYLYVYVYTVGMKGSPIDEFRPDPEV